MFSTLLMGGGGHEREKDHQNVKSLIIFARDCRGGGGVVEDLLCMHDNNQYSLGYRFNPGTV
jgi:hypothetical protein